MRKSRKWFENFPKDKLKEVCDRLEITPENFYKAAILEDDGSVSIDYLKCDRPTPESWDVPYKWVSEHITDPEFKFYETTSLHEDVVNTIAKMYSSYIDKPIKLNKIPDTAYVRAKAIEISNIFKNFCETYDMQDEDVKKFMSMNIVTHMELFLNDLNVVNKKSMI